jgi:diguanylate cyclase (GGDEF)-like protein
MATDDSTAAHPAARAAWDAHFRAPEAGVEHARAMHAAATDPAERGWHALTIAYHALFFSSQPASARPLLDDARASFTRVGDRRGELLVDVGFARLAVTEGAPVAARERLQALEAEMRDALTAEDLFWYFDVVAAAHFFTDAFDEAIRYLYEALDVLRGVDAPAKLSAIMSNLAAALVAVGDHAPAAELASAALADLGDGHPQLVLFALANLAEALAGLDEYARAAEVVDSMLAEARHASRESEQNHWFAIAAEVYAHEGRIDDAVRAARAARDVRDAFPAGYNDVHALWSDAVVAGACDADDAIARLEAAAEAAARRRYPGVLCKALARLAQSYVGRGDFELAYRASRRLLDAQSSRLAQRASARYSQLRHEYELRHVRSERDRELEKRREVEALNAELARLNADLQHKMIQIEALQAQLAVEVLHDPLTQLFNRRYLDSVVPGLLGSAERRGSALSLALVDLDHFKLVNDRYGHSAGDAVLREMGRVLPMALRAADIVCRYGGEEFCVVLPDADATGADKVLASLAARLRDLRVEWNGQSLGGFTFSAGVALYGVHGITLGELLGAADRALYEAKDAGRNRVHVAREA